jgi:hypothetical protein
VRGNPTLDSLKILTGETDERLLLTLLSLSKERLINHLYPYHPEVTDLPGRYGGKQVEIAVYLYSKMGAEGQTAHSENGISRSYESADIPDSMLRDIVPLVKVI